MKVNDLMSKEQALANWLDHSDLSDIEYIGDDTYSVGRKEYLVLTDEEADEACESYIRDTLWAFRAEFLCCYIPKVDPDHIEMIQRGLYESCNELIFQLVEDDFDRLVRDALTYDERGHFLSQYDGEEHEEGDYFIYRIN